MGGALELHGEALQQIFAHFSGVDATDKKAKLAAGMMNVMECHELCESLGLYAIGENEFTIKEMLVCFVKVNLDDELFYQESNTYYGYTDCGYTDCGYPYYYDLFYQEEEGNKEEGKTGSGSGAAAGNVPQSRPNEEGGKPSADMSALRSLQKKLAKARKHLKACKVAFKKACNDTLRERLSGGSGVAEEDEQQG